MYKDYQKKVDNDNDNDLDKYEFKITFIGNCNVGKTTILNNIIGEKILPQSSTKNTSLIFRIKNSSSYSIYNVKNNKEVSLIDINSNDTIQTKMHKIVEELNNVYRSKQKKEINSDYQLNIPIKNILHYNVILQDTPGLDEEITKYDTIIKEIVDTHVIYYIFKLDSIKDELLTFQNVLKFISISNSNLLNNIYIIINQCDNFENIFADSREPILFDTYINEQKNEIKKILKEYDIKNNNFITLSNSNKNNNDKNNDMSKLFYNINKVISDKVNIINKYYEIATNTIKSEVVYTIDFRKLDEQISENIKSRLDELWKIYIDDETKKMF